MDLFLIRNSKRPDGIFSNLVSSVDGAVLPGSVAVTVEHAYLGDGGYQPKLQNGTFECVRGKHRLHGMDHDFETFEITGVPGHTGMLFHWGNYNEDSDGCVCTGDAVSEGDHDGRKHCEMVTNSRVAFARFMRLQEGVDRFTLRVY
jgi:hypothetical protein